MRRSANYTLKRAVLCCGSGTFAATQPAAAWVPSGARRRAGASQGRREEDLSPGSRKSL